MVDKISKYGWLNWTRKNYLKASFLLKCFNFNFNFFLILTPFFLFSECSYLDLEKGVQDFVLQTEQIIIPEHPFAFNPSIVHWNNKFLMSYRVISQPIDSIHSASDSYIFISKLDATLKPIGNPIKILLGTKDRPSHLEDARLISIHNELFIVYSDHPDEPIREGGFRVYIAKLEYDEKNDQFNVIFKEGLTEFEGESFLKREKNWTPFEYHGNLLLSYSLAPHLIFFPLLNETGKSITLYKTKPSIVWEWGELRGGTPALKIDEQHYLSFFHSSKISSSIHSEGKPTLHYFMGAYLFSSQPPFQILQVSPEPIIGENFYHGLQYDPYWKPVNVVFPCGYIFDDQFIWISYGRQDHEIWIVKLDKEGLLNSLINVSSNP